MFLNSEQHTEIDACRMPFMRSIVRAAGKLIAWIETKAGGEVVGAFLGETTENKRLPAIRVCSSPQEAHAWIEREAIELGLPVEWIAS